MAMVNTRPPCPPHMPINLFRHQNEHGHEVGTLPSGTSTNTCTCRWVCKAEVGSVQILDAVGSEDESQQTRAARQQPKINSKDLKRMHMLPFHV